MVKSAIKLLLALLSKATLGLESFSWLHHSCGFDQLECLECGLAQAPWAWSFEHLLFELVMSDRWCYDTGCTKRWCCGWWVQQPCRLFDIRQSGWRTDVRLKTSMEPVPAAPERERSALLLPGGAFEGWEIHKYIYIYKSHCIATKHLEHHHSITIKSLKITRNSLNPP